MSTIRAVIPVAGWGTRSLPATKNVPKEMLPVYKKPVVQYILEEAGQAGIEDIIFITNRDKKIIEDHFDYHPVLEKVLERAGKKALLAQIQAVAEMAHITAIRQRAQRGLGHAVLCAEPAVSADPAVPFALLLADDLMVADKPAIGELLEVARKEKKAVVGVMEVAPEKVSNYGIIASSIRADMAADMAADTTQVVYEVSSLVEKPAPDKAPSRLAVVGRYVLFPEIFDYLRQVRPGVGGEIQLTDALQYLARQGRLLAVPMKGRRFDAGDWVQYLSANIYFALQDDALHDELITSLAPLLASCKK